MRTHIVIQPHTWYEGETLCCGWAYLSDAMPESCAHAFARNFPEAKVILAGGDLPEPIRKPAMRPCPFCGSVNVMPTQEKGQWFVCCDQCNASSTAFSPEKMTDAEIFRLLAESWNKREPETCDLARLRQIEKWARRESGGL